LFEHWEANFLELFCINCEDSLLVGNNFEWNRNHQI